METVHLPPLRPDPDAGLTRAQAAERARAGLRNTPPPDLTKSTGRILRDNLLTFYNLLFLALAGCLVAVGAVQETLFLGIVLCNAAVGVVQELRVRAALRRIALLAARPVRAVREGRECLLEPAELVRDDLVLLRQGDQVPADARLARGRVECNESLVTGEEDPVPHREGDGLLAGSFLTAGSCAAWLERVGPDSCAARITGEARRARGRRSRMMRSLDGWLRLVGALILPLGLALAARQWPAGPAPAVVSTVAALVGMVPEGLYLLVSVALAVSVLNLSRRRTLVRELACIENLAHVDTLCLDKTGTLTAGELQLEELLPAPGLPEAELAALLGGYVHALPETNATDRALRSRLPGQGWRAAGQVPFSSARKWSALARPEGDCLALGAPEMVLGPDRQRWEPLLRPRLDQGRRVLALVRLPALPAGQPPRLPAGARLVGFAVLRDKLRPRTAETLAYFRAQGVRLMVLSGDSAAAVSRVAALAGVEQAHRYCDLAGVGEEADWAGLARRYTVFGRVSPRQKQLLIAAMQREGHSVAMVGDGVNDVPALSQADCSLAMGAGSEAARQAAQLVLLDSDFAAVPAILQEGRRVIGNISRSAALFLYKNIFSFLVSAALLALALPYPLVPRQVSLISGLLIGLPSFLLTFEPVRDRARGGFLSNALLAALPGGLAATLGVLAAATLGAGLPRDQLSTLCALLAALAGMLVILRLCVPLTRRRAAVLALCLGGFAGACLLLPGFFALHPLGSPALGLLGGCAAATALAFALLQGASGWLRRRAPVLLPRPADGRRSDLT